MNQAFAWLKRLLTRSNPDSTAESPEPSTSAQGSNTDLNLPPEIQDLVDDSSLPDHADTIPDLRPSKSDRASGFDPYDTAVLHKK